MEDELGTICISAFALAVVPAWQHPQTGEWGWLEGAPGPNLSSLYTLFYSVIYNSVERGLLVD